MGAIVLTVKINNCKTPFPEAASRLILRKNLFIKSNYKPIGETPNKQHLLQSNLLSNHIEVRLIVRLSTEFQDPKNNFPKKTSPENLLTNYFTSSHTISKQR